MKLVSTLTEIKEQYLEADYKRFCRDDHPLTTDSLPEPDEMDDEEAAPADNEGGSCWNLVKSMQEDSRNLAADMKAEETGETQELPEMQEMTAEREFQNMPDGEGIIAMLQATDSSEPFGTEQLYHSPSGDKRRPTSSKDSDHEMMPVTLSQALSMRGDLWNNLFRLTV